MANRIILNGTSYFGRGSREEMIHEFEKRNFKKALVVSDYSLVAAGVTKLVTDILDKNSIEYDLYSKIKPNPTVRNIQEGVSFCKKSEADVLIAVGGGSSIDTAKAIGIIMTNKEYGDVISLDGAVETRNPSLPIIAIPTTAGTAAEVTINYVITDENAKKKMVCVDPNDIPIVAIIDPDLMETMPKNLAAATGMDALTHAIEGYITKAAWLIPDMFHINAMSLIFKNLEKAVNEKDSHSIEQVAYGQYIAGMGFSNVGLGIVHSMAHSLGAIFDTPHGVANALLLPHVLKFNGEVCPELFLNMGQALGLNMEGLSGMNAVNKVVEGIRDLSIKIGIPQTLKDLEIPYSSLPLLAHQAAKDICTGGNPRNVTEEDILEIYQNAYQ